RAVPLVVVRRRLAVDEVDEGRDALVAVRILLAGADRQVVVPGGDAGIDNRHADARTGQTKPALDGARADRQRGTKIRSRNRPIEIDGEHRGMRLEIAQLRIRHRENLRVENAETLAGPRRQLLESRRQLRTRLQRDDDARRTQWRLSDPAREFMI